MLEKKWYCLKLLNKFKEELHGRKVAVYPYGENGRLVTEYLWDYFGIKADLIIDNDYRGGKA